MTEDIGHLVYKNNNYYSYDSITYEIVKNRDSNPDIKFYYHDDVYDCSLRPAICRKLSRLSAWN